MVTTVKNRNITFSDAAHVIWEGSHALLYRAGTDGFGKPSYNIAILKFTTWIPTPELYWASYTTDHGAYGPNGLDHLITSAQEVNRQAALVHAHLGNIEDVIRVARAEKIGHSVIYDITGYYVVVDTGYYVGPNKHTGTVA